MTASGSATTQYLSGLNNTYSFTASGGMVVDGSAVTQYVEFTEPEYVKPDYPGLIGPSRSDKKRVKDWLEQFKARTFGYVAKGGLKVSGRAFTNVVIEVPRERFRMDERVVRPLLTLRRKPKKVEKPLEVDFSSIEAEKKQRRRKEEEFLLLIA
jgi:hypothetical protein